MAGIDDTENIHKAMGSEIVTGIGDTIKSVLAEIAKPNTAADIYTQRGDSVPGIYPRSPFEGGSPGKPSGASGNFGIEPPVPAPIPGTGNAKTPSSVPNSAAPFVSSINARVRDIGGGNEATYGMASPEQMKKNPEKGGGIEPFINLGAKGGVDRFALRPTASAELFPGKGTPAAPAAGIGDTVAIMTKRLADLQALPKSTSQSGTKYTPKEVTAEIDKITTTLGHIAGQKVTTDQNFEFRKDKLAQDKMIHDENLAERKYQHGMLGGEKANVDYQKMLDVTAPSHPTAVDAAGKPIKLYDVAYLDRMDRGESPEKMPGNHGVIARNLWDTRESQITQDFLDAWNKGNKDADYKAEDINKKGTNTYRLRQVAIKKYRENLIKNNANTAREPI